MDVQKGKKKSLGALPLFDLECVGSVRPDLLLNSGDPAVPPKVRKTKLGRSVLVQLPEAIFSQLEEDAEKKGYEDVEDSILVALMRYLSP